MQPNSYAHLMSHIPHDPDDKDRELDLAVERYLENCNELAVGLVLWFPERKLRSMVPEGRIETLGPDLSPWIGWGEIKSMTVVTNEDHPQRSYADLILRFEHSGQALVVGTYLNTPWVARL